MITVSIAMATFNGARYIRQQLASLAAQTHPPSELVVTDDGSSDETLDLVDSFAGSAPFRIRVHRNETRLGYRANFLRATTLCNSDLIAFCDQDDIWDRRKIEICLPFFDNPDVLLVYHNAITVTADGHPIGSLDHCASPRVINPPMSTRPWPIRYGFTQVFRRAVPFLPDLWAVSLDPLDVGQQMAHDQWFYFLSSVLGSIAYVKEPLAYYRQHASNAKGSGKSVHVSDNVRLFFANSADRYAHGENCGRECAFILDEAKEGWGSTWRNRASVAAQRFRRLAQQYGNRKILYTTSDARRRLMAFRNIFSSGGYKRHDEYSFGPKSLVKDAVLGIVMGQRLKKLAPDASSPVSAPAHQHVNGK